MKTPFFKDYREQRRSPGATISRVESTIAEQMVFTAVLFAIGFFCLFVPGVIQRLVVKRCPKFLTSYVQADFYRTHVRICGCIAVLMAGLMMYATFWSQGD